MMVNPFSFLVLSILMAQTPSSQNSQQTREVHLDRSYFNFLEPQTQTQTQTKKPQITAAAAAIIQLEKLKTDLKEIRSQVIQMKEQSLLKSKLEEQAKRAKAMPPVPAPKKVWHKIQFMNQTRWVWGWREGNETGRLAKHLVSLYRAGQM